MDYFTTIAILTKAHNVLYSLAMEEAANAAIDAALKNDWDRAIELNSAILKENPNDLEALNRLAQAYLQLGELDNAKNTYRKVLRADPYNLIAKKNLKRISDGFIPSTKNSLGTDSVAIFLEEPGKTKTVNLINCASSQTLAKLSHCDLVNLIVKKHSVVVQKDGMYLGALPDDLAFRIIRLISLGNRYQAFVKSIDGNNIQIFLQELKRAKRLGNQASFPQGKNLDYQPSIGKKMISGEEPPIELGDDDEEEKRGDGEEQEESKRDLF